MGGLQVLRKIRDVAPHCRVILMTGVPDMAVAVEAVRIGAHDVIGKPIDFDRLARIFDDARDENARQRQVRAIEQQLAAQVDFHGMVGRSPKMESLFSFVRRLAPHVRTALIEGETGTGKELVARALHARSPRAARPLVVVNCAAIVPSLFESELFGHTRGAFTGATELKAGLFELANHGTLFFDEIGELPLEVQSKLLRVLDSGETKRVGATETRHVDVHVIAATNRNLATEVEQGRFRADLFYRLNVVELRVPPLRDRREDIPLLVAGFVREFAQACDKSIAGVTAGVEQVWLDAEWPGNVRQLRNVVERACMMTDGAWITDAGVTGPLRASPDRRGVEAPRAPRREIDKVEVIAALESCRGNKTHAAAHLGISRRAFYRLIEGFGLP